MSVLTYLTLSGLLAASIHWKYYPFSTVAKQENSYGAASVTGEHYISSQMVPNGSNSVRYPDRFAFHSFRWVIYRWRLQLHTWWLG